ncbi:MAG: rod shape-determining protein MreC [Proteobacteria bacterium]|nr:rod shape-determining protein MreC [Pseudomonadota bacterium]
MRRSLSLSSLWSQPLGAVVLIAAALILILFNFIFPQSAAAFRAGVVDFFAPVIHIFAKPAEMLQGLQGGMGELAHLREENARLQKEVANLKGWAQAAQQFEEENKSLQSLLKYKDEAVLSYLTARVIAENGGGLNDSAIITAGARDGVEKNMVVLDEDGVVGRVIEVGDWSARILLINDFNFRLPVMVEEARQRAIFTGQGREAPKLLYIAQESDVKPGMRVVTSGQGGIFPPGLPVGAVKEVAAHNITVTPFGRLDRLTVVRLAHYQLSGQASPAAPVPAVPASSSPAPAAPPVPAAPAAKAR